MTAEEEADARAEQRAQVAALRRELDAAEDTLDEDGGQDR
jgi:hypothetical protein